MKYSFGVKSSRELNSSNVLHQEYIIPCGLKANMVRLFYKTSNSRGPGKTSALRLYNKAKIFHYD
jgi:hypothetical protein